MEMLNEVRGQGILELESNCAQPYTTCIYEIGMKVTVARNGFENNHSRLIRSGEVESNFGCEIEPYKNFPSGSAPISQVCVDKIVVEIHVARTKKCAR